MRMLRRLKSALLEQGTGAAGVRAVAWARTHLVPIFMMHRFGTNAMTTGHDPVALRHRLREIKERGFTVLALADAFGRLAAGEPVERTIVFTVDDGYADFARVGAPVFVESGVPVTVFLATDFIDGRGWNWWDQVEYVLTRTQQRQVTITLGDRPISLALSADSRQTAQEDLVARLKRVGDDARLEAVRALSAACEVAIPPTAPDDYAPMSWDDVRFWENHGVTFGPHSSSHPILSRVPDSRVAREIEGAWERLRAECRSPLPIFCYPNGQPGDFGPREQELLKAAGFVGALASHEGYASREDFDPKRPLARFAVPRFGYVEDRAGFWQIAGGLRRLRDLVAWR